jgi:predicted phosphodiesterase
MLIAIISDTHSRETSVQDALAIMAERGVEMILHCGDIQDGHTCGYFLLTRTLSTETATTTVTISNEL